MSPSSLASTSLPVWGRRGQGLSPFPARKLILKRYGDKALEQSDRRVDELTAAGDHDGADTWRRISAAVVQLANTTPSGPLH